MLKNKQLKNCSGPSQENTDSARASVAEEPKIAMSYFNLDDMWF